MVYAGSVNGTDRATYAVTINPLVMWVWIGAGILITGGLITMWPGGMAVQSRHRSDVQAGYEAPLIGVGSGR